MSQELIERLKLEAQIHAQEARTANATIAEIYQLCSGGKGELGNWHGAEPVRALVAERDALAATLRQQAARVDEGMLRNLAHLWRQIERGDEPQTEFDKGYEQASQECASTLEAALSAQPAPERQGEDGLYVEARQCEDCDHLGINDCSDTASACRHCEWQGPTPDEDKCPGCDHKNCMTAACPKCGGRYRFLADRQFTHPAAPVGVPDGATLPIDVRGKWHDVAIPVHLHVIALRDRLGQLEAGETLVAVYDAVSRSNLTRDVKTPETKARIVREALAAAPSAPQGTQQGEG